MGDASLGGDRYRPPRSGEASVGTEWRGHPRLGRGGDCGAVGSNAGGGDGARTSFWRLVVVVVVERRGAVSSSREETE